MPVLERKDIRDRARIMRSGGKEYATIAALLGVSKTTVYRWLNPESVAATERRRRAAKREHERHSRRRSCECGGVVWKGHARCLSCHRAHIRAVHEIRLSVIEGVWAEGWSSREIADLLGYEQQSAISPLIKELRQQGRAPYRYSPRANQRYRHVA